MAPLMIPDRNHQHIWRVHCRSTIRLFANMFAGEQVTLVFLGLTYLIAPAMFLGLHVFVGLLQAYIFVLLTMMYVGGAPKRMGGALQCGARTRSSADSA